MNNTNPRFCEQFSDQSKLDTYLQLAIGAPGGWNDTVRLCRREICPTLLGGIDNDIAGMGVSLASEGGLRMT
jgi:hypothetical protein